MLRLAALEAPGFQQEAPIKNLQLSAMRLQGFQVDALPVFGTSRTFGDSGEILYETFAKRPLFAPSVVRKCSFTIS